VSSSEEDLKGTPFEEPSATYDEPQTKPKGGVTEYKMWHLQYYGMFFNVDSFDVSARVFRSIVPFSVRFFDSLGNNPDLWGPFWIPTTLIFVMAAGSNFASWLNDRTYHYDFTVVTIGAGVIYAYAFILPFLLWLVCRWLNTGLSLTKIVCIYGYDLSIFIPAGVICVIPYEWLRWGTVGIAALDSLLFLSMNFFPPMISQQTEHKKTLGGVIVLGIMVVLHLGFALFFLAYFSKYF